MPDKPDTVDRPEKQDEPPTSKAAAEVREAVRAAAEKSRDSARRTYDRIKAARKERIANQKKAD